MNLVIDLGNTAAKVAAFENNRLTLYRRFSHDEINLISEKFPFGQFENVILSSVIDHNLGLEEQIKKETTLLLLNENTPIFFENKYQTPATLGRDRLANAAGLCAIYPNQNVLCIDLGTCLKFDFVNSKNQYLGGAISPGFEMRFKALHTFTDKLPFLEMQTIKHIIGRNSQESMVSGVYQGMLAEIRGIILEYKANYNDLKVILTGGNSAFFENELKKSIFADAFFTLKGLNAILNYNAK